MKTDEDKLENATVGLPKALREWLDNKAKNNVMSIKLSRAQVIRSILEEAKAREESQNKIKKIAKGGK